MELQAVLGRGPSDPDYRAGHNQLNLNTARILRLLVEQYNENVVIFNRSSDIPDESLRSGLYEQSRLYLQLTLVDLGDQVGIAAQQINLTLDSDFELQTHLQTGGNGYQLAVYKMLHNLRGRSAELYEDAQLLRNKGASIDLQRIEDDDAVLKAALTLETLVPGSKDRLGAFQDSLIATTKV